MKNLLPLFASAILLAGCAADDAANPWSTEQERADAHVAQAAAPAGQTAAPVAADTTAAPAGEAKYSWQKKAANEPKPEPKPLAEGKAIVTALRGDAGLIQIKLSQTVAPNDKFVLTKDGKGLLIVIHSVDGEAVIANIAPRQLNTPTINVGDEVACAAYEAPAAK